MARPSIPRPVRRSKSASVLVWRRSSSSFTRPSSGSSARTSRSVARQRVRAGGGRPIPRIQAELQAAVAPNGGSTPRTGSPMRSSSTSSRRPGTICAATRRLSPRATPSTPGPRTSGGTDLASTASGAISAARSPTTRSLRGGRYSLANLGARYRRGNRETADHQRRHRHEYSWGTRTTCRCTPATRQTCSARSVCA